jgi:flagellar biogenesis protein FliO
MNTGNANSIDAVTRPPLLAAVLARVRGLWGSQEKRNALVIRETAALGERRFVAVVQCGRQRFLIGAAPGSVALLSVLTDEPAAGDAL